MRTPVGAHAVQTAASVRAGVNRFRRWPHFGITTGGEDDGLTASFLAPDLGDDPWTAKVWSLVEQPLAEAIAAAGLEGARAPARVATIIALPVWEEPAERETEDEDEDEDDAAAGSALDELAASLREDLPWCLRAGGDRGALELLCLGTCGGLAAVGRAVERLARKDVDACVVGGIDSFLDQDRLERLLADGRLKVPATSSGLIPAEGAGFVVLERTSSAQRRGAAILARIAGVALERDEAWRPDVPVTAAGLSRCLRVAVDSLQGSGGATAVINDLNGERWRFLEWALAETRCLGTLPRGWRLWHPADCLGDVGAAFGPIAVGLAARAFARRYAGGGGVIVTAASDSGERGAVALSPPEGAN